MKKLLLIAGAALALIATPAAAGPRPYVEATGSTATSNINREFDRDGVSFGTRVGLENQPNTNLSLFAEVGAENFLRDGPTTLLANTGLNLRLGGSLSTYGSVGYLNTDGNSGYRLGAGLGLDLTRNLRLRGGIERDDYGNGADGLRGVVGASVRF